VIPEDTGIHARLTDPKLVYGQYGRQVEVTVRVLEGEHRGVEFRNWFSFGKDKETSEEFVSYGGPLYQALSLVADGEIDSILEDDDLSDREYEKFLKSTVKKLDGVEIQGRVGVKATEKNPEAKRNFLQPGNFGLYVDPDEKFTDIPFDGGEDEEEDA
jgi:hypothetical protein